MIEQIATLRESLTEKYGFENIIGHSSSLRAAIGIASRAARSSSVVLIEGETGTGKELLARAVHANSPRSEEPFVAVNCGAIPRDLLESELFGYKKGAFTGATNSKAGRIEGAEGELSFWMRSASFLYSSKLSFCGLFRKARSRNWARSSQ